LEFRIKNFPNWRRVVDDVRTYWQNPSNWFFIPKLSADSAVVV